MRTKIIHVGIDVDDNSFTGAAFFLESGELINFKAKPNSKSLENKLKELKTKFPDYEIKSCYEATYLGFSLQRDMNKLGHQIDVIAPTSIPRKNKKNIKTDRIDAGKLAEFYANNQLTIVPPPDPQIEQDRDLSRSRQFIIQQLHDLRIHLQSLLRRNGLHFKAETNEKCHWTCHHRSWLEATIEKLSGSLKVSLQLLYQQIKWLEYTLSEYDKAIDALAESEKYQKQVKSLTCYKGIKNIWAMMIITEIGNIKRFSHPRGLVSYMGLDLREYTSGGKELKFGITHAGNRYLRTAFTEANQRGWRSPQITKHIKERRAETPIEFIAIADRCAKRLYKKGYRMLQAGKHHNKIKIACAREMIGFVWESLNLADAAA